MSKIKINDLDNNKNESFLISVNSTDQEAVNGGFLKVLKGIYYAVGIVKGIIGIAQELGSSSSGGGGGYSGGSGGGGGGVSRAGRVHMK